MMRSPISIDLVFDLDGDVAGLAAHLADEHRQIAADQRDIGIRLVAFSGMRLPTCELQHVAQRHLDGVEHRLDRHAGVPELAGEMRFPDRIAAEFLAEEALQQDLAHRLQGRVRQQHFEPAAAIFHVDAQPRQHGGIGRPADRRKARIGLEPVEAESDRAQRIEGAGQIGEHDRDEALDQVALDGRVGPAFDAHRRRAAAAAEEHVDDRIDQRAVDGEQAVIVPLLGLEDASASPAAGSN